MSRRRRPSAFLLSTVLGIAAGGCRDEVPLGAWELEPEAMTSSVATSTTGDASAMASGSGGSSTAVTASSSDAGGATETTTTGASFELPSCGEEGTPGAYNAMGSEAGATETATDWTWASPVSSMQWDLMVEREIERESPDAPPTSGYYWVHQFSFLEGISGRLGIQAEGLYQTDPPDSPVEFTKIAVFWLSGPPLAAELGDIDYPDARVASETAFGVEYLTIHARFAWQACRTYRFRFAPDSTEPNGSIWYGAWINDVSAGVETLLGRMLLPEDSGQLSPFSVSRTLPIIFGEQTCSVPQPISALFGVPRTTQGDMQAELGSNRFVNLRCPSSRFTVFDGAVRQELAIE